MSKKESVEEYLQRGGKVTKLDPVQDGIKCPVVRSTKAAPATILSLEEGEYYYGEKSKRKKKEKKVDLEGVNLDLIDDNLLKSLGIK